MNIEAPLDGLTLGDLRTLVAYSRGKPDDEEVLTLTDDDTGDAFALMITGVDLPTI